MAQRDAGDESLVTGWYDAGGLLQEDGTKTEALRHRRPAPQDTNQGAGEGERQTRTQSYAGASSPRSAGQTFTATKENVQNNYEAMVSIPALDYLWDVRQRWRQNLESQVEWSLELLPYVQRWGGERTTKLMLCASWIGSEDSYVLLLPFLFWVAANGTYARSFALLWGMNQYLGGTMKNWLCLPRPPQKYRKVLRSMTLSNSDFGWPSVHTVNAVSLPFFILRQIFVPVFLWDAGQPMLVVAGYAVGFVLALTIIVSRMYLGVHSPADIQGGAVIGAVIFRLWVNCYTEVDSWIIGLPHLPLLAALFGLFLCVIHPKVYPETSTFEENVCLSGFIAGMFSSYAVAEGSLGWQLPAPANHPLWKILARLALGYPLLLASKATAKALLCRLFAVARARGEQGACSVAAGEATEEETRAEASSNAGERNELDIQHCPSSPPYHSAYNVDFKSVKAMAAEDMVRRFLEYYIGLGWGLGFIVPAVYLHLGL